MSNTKMMLNMFGQRRLEWLQRLPSQEHCQVVIVSMSPEGLVSSSIMALSEEQFWLL